MAKRKAIAEREITCPVENIFEEITLLLKASEEISKRTDDFHDTAVLVHSRHDLRERCAAALRARSHVGAMLQISLIRGLVQELVEQIEMFTQDDKEKHRETRNEAAAEVRTAEFQALDFVTQKLGDDVQEIKRLVDSCRSWPSDKGKATGLGRISGDETGPCAA